ncbi:hypothetical protein MK489_10280 [Myxococcota bacterium]|nr:hypothetical protein [Myxococcota bacterium]
MGDSKVIAGLLAAVCALGCANLRWQVEKSLRQEGTVNRAFPEVVWDEYNCEKRDLPFLEIETSELIPPEVEPGGDFNHRLVYALCPRRATEVVSGDLHTRILFKGRAIHQETHSNYELRPGRWQVDTFVEIPLEAEPGVYAHEVEFSSRHARFERTITFLVPEP